MSATDIDLAAADWLQKKTFWNWTDEDQKSLDAWLDERGVASVALIKIDIEGAEILALRGMRRGLAAGRYRFQVRAIGADGKVVSEPATMAFVIPPPIWLRWWFLTIAAAVAAAGIYAIYRARLQRALAIERVRTRIATDLHDDLGASLSRVSILSEVVKQRLDPVDDVSASLLGEIADASQQPVDDARRTARAARDLERTVRIDVDLEQLRRAHDDARQLLGGVELEPRDDAEPVAQRIRQHAGARGRADQSERRQVELHASRRRSLADHDVDLEVLERRIEDLLDDR